MSHLTSQHDVFLDKMLQIRTLQNRLNSHNDEVLVAAAAGKAAVSVPAASASAVSSSAVNYFDATKVPSATQHTTTPPKAEQQKRGRGRPKGRKTTSHPLISRPKRPLSAYNLYFKDQREMMLKQGNEDNEQTSNDPATAEEENKARVNRFADVARIVGPKWRTLDEETKQKYAAKAKVEMAKYKEAMEVYNKKVEELTKLENLQKEAIANIDENEEEQKNKTTAIGAGVKRARDDYEGDDGNNLLMARSKISPRTLLSVDAKKDVESQQRERRLMYQASQQEQELADQQQLDLLHYRRNAAMTSLLMNNPQQTTALDLGAAASALRRPVAPSSTAAAAAAAADLSSLTAARRYQAAAIAAAAGAGFAAPHTHIHRQAALPPSAAAAATESQLSDVIFKRALELKAAKRLIEEREQQLQHDMVLNAAFERNQHLADVNLMIQLKKQQEEIRRNLLHR